MKKPSARRAVRAKFAAASRTRAIDCHMTLADDEPSPTAAAGAGARVGKAELLRWASELTGFACERMDDLRSGAVLARVFLHVFPRLSGYGFKPKWDPKWEWEVGLNWEVVEQMGANARRFELAARRASSERLQTLPLAGGGLPPWHGMERRYATPAAGGGVGACSWDALQLPLRSASVDLCVVDLPFGMACKVKGGIKSFYPRAVLQMARVLRPGGRLVMLSPSRQLLLQVPAVRPRPRGGGG